MWYQTLDGEAGYDTGVVSLDAGAQKQLEENATPKARIFDKSRISIIFIMVADAENTAAVALGKS